MSVGALTHSVLRRFISRSGPGNTSRHDAAPATVPYQANTSSLAARLSDVFSRTFDLGFTAFGGPPVHFQIFHQRFVNGHGKTPWIDEQTYQELFALSQALPGPASTKMLFNIAQIHAGLLPALFVFCLWSLPGSIAMYGLSLGVQKIGERLPGPAYALLSGINAATVGIIALAAVQLSKKAITDPLSRLLVIFGGCFGLCYNALWYFPVLLVFAGLITVAWDLAAQPKLRRWRNKRRARRTSSSSPGNRIAEETGIPMDQFKAETDRTGSPGPLRRQTPALNFQEGMEQEPVSVQPLRIDIFAHKIQVKIGIAIILSFFSIFTVFMVLRSVLHSAPLLLRLFNNVFLAGTIIFGGGPVVIPLLRDYVVAPGWVSPRDFLLGLAVIQALPGPNFNFAVYLGALALAGPMGPKSVPTIVGALVSFVGIFAPGLLLSIGFQSIWRSLRKRREVVSSLRGVNAAAVGFVFTAVYRLWEIGYLTEKASTGVSLGLQPWWLVIAAVIYAFVEWFSVPPPVAILGGGVAGLGWWGAVGRHLSG